MSLPLLPLLFSVGGVSLPLLQPTFPATMRSARSPGKRTPSLNGEEPEVTVALLDPVKEPEVADDTTEEDKQRTKNLIISFLLSACAAQLAFVSLHTHACCLVCSGVGRPWQQDFPSAAVCALWCGVVWCGVVWCGVVWCGVLLVFHPSVTTSVCPSPCHTRRFPCTTTRCL